MHEMGIAMQVVEIAKDAIPPEMADRAVEQVNLTVGRLSAVVPDSLRFCYEIIVADTVLAGSRLNIAEIPVLCRCHDCGHEWTVEQPVFICESCRSGRIEIIAGQELEVTSIELADADPPSA